MSKILIVDDDKDISELVSLILKKENIDSDIINNPLEALSLLEKGNNNYNLILLDIMMPELSGTELCSKIRDKVDIPIIFLSAKKELIDKMLGYEIGGDDYITKPFDNTELVLKVKSHLRLNKRISNNTHGKIITIGEISLNEESFEVRKNGELIELSTREFELLKYLMQNAGIALSKEQIFDAVWGYDYGDIGTVAVNIKNLRDKLENDNNKNDSKKDNNNKDDNKYIITIWGYGYKFIRT